MEKNSTSQDYEIDLIGILKFLWESKIKIFLIVVIFFLIGFGYNYRIPNTYTSTLIINPSSEGNFTKLRYFLESTGQLNQIIQPEKKFDFNEIILQKFLKDLMDYEELVVVLKNNMNIKKNISKLDENDQKQELFNYSKSLKVNLPDAKDKNYSITFKWNDISEAREILRETLNLTLINFEKSMYLEIETLLNAMKVRKKNDDVERIIYLTEQSLIAKELNLPDNQIDNFNLSQSNVSFSINANDVGYYLRGYRAIDKEIDLIRERKYEKFDKLENEINLLKKINIEWVDYNIYLINTKSQKKTQLILIISVLFGLIVGIFYALISNVLAPKTISKETNK